MVENVAALAHLFLRVWEQLVDDWNGLQDIKHYDRDHDVPHGHHVGWRYGGHDGQVEDQLQGFDHGLDFRERSSDQEFIVSQPSQTSERLHPRFAQARAAIAVAGKLVFLPLDSADVERRDAC